MNKEEINNFKAFHIVWTTHNARVSKDLHTCYNYRGKSESSLLTDKEIVIVVESIKNKIINFQAAILAFSILPDHIHLLLVCRENELNKIIGQLKGYSARVVNSLNRGVNPSVEKGNYADGTIQKLWAKGYSRTVIVSKQQLSNTLNYIENNYYKHGNYTPDKKVAVIIQSLLTSVSNLEVNPMVGEMCAEPIPGKQRPSRQA